MSAGGERPPQRAHERTGRQNQEVRHKHRIYNSLTDVGFIICSFCVVFHVTGVSMTFNLHFSVIIVEKNCYRKLGRVVATSVKSGEYKRKYFCAMFLFSVQV